MRTAVDTNIISALWTGEPHADEARVALLRARDEGSLVISPVVYAEISAHPRATAALVGGFLSDTGIEVDFAISERAWREVANRFSRYAKRRPASHGGLPKRLLADFVVAAHALVQADRLMTLDSGAFYHRDFHELQLLNI